MSDQVTLLILDGWGISQAQNYNAIAKGQTPVFDKLNGQAPYIHIQASGLDVGLPDGQMGNSEVGHMNIGAGRIVYQSLMRISNEIKEGAFYRNEALLNAVKRAREKKSALHIIGLVSDGGVHSHIDQILALVELGAKNGLEKIFVHALMDGRDTPPDSGAVYIERLTAGLKSIGVGTVATCQGRFYGMDRDKRWERVERGYNLMVNGDGRKNVSALGAVRASYADGVMDEFIKPVVITDEDGEPVGLIGDGDEIIMANFRADRMRQITQALYDPDFTEFKRKKFPRAGMVCMTEYDAKFKLDVAYKSTAPAMGLGQILADNGLKQLRIAETEKYAHVTFFFNGGLESPFEGESRNLVPSPRVRTYDLQPRMSCPEVTDKVVAAIKSGEFTAHIINLANGDMVGHTGVWPSAIEAVNVIDSSVGRIMEVCEKTGSHLIITADHGNIESMVDDNGKPMTQHTTNPVPLYYIGDQSLRLKDGGRLADIAPTILRLLGLPQPDVMTGESLVTNR